MTAPVSPPQPTAEPVRQHTPLWELHRQDDYADHEFSFWFDGEIVVLANPAFGRVAVLQEMVDGLNSHASLKARAEQAEQAVDVLESNAREQAKLLADTGRRVEELEAALRPFAEMFDVVTEQDLAVAGIEEMSIQAVLYEPDQATISDLRAARTALSPSTPVVSR